MKFRTTTKHIKENYSKIISVRNGQLYTLLKNHNAIAYTTGAYGFMLVVNAGNRAKDGAWVFSHLNGDVTYVDQGDLWGELALQGPLAGKVAEKLVKKEDLPDLYYYFSYPVDVNVGNRTIQCNTFFCNRITDIEHKAH